MSEKSPDSVLSSLPRSRPHRRSAKRAARAEETNPTGADVTAEEAVQMPPQPEPPEQPEPGRPMPGNTLPTGTELAGTVLKAAVELAEIGLTVSARALRIALSRLPRP